MTALKPLLLVVGVLFVAVLMAGCAAIVGAAIFLDDDLLSSLGTAEFETIDDWPGAAEFEEQFDLDFPPSSRDIRLASDGFQEPIYQYRLTIDPEELPILTSSTGCNGLLSQPASQPPKSVMTTELDWWSPEAATTYQRCAGIETLGRAQQVFVDLTDPAASLVYILVIYY